MTTALNVIERARERVRSDWDSERGLATDGRFNLLRSLWGPETHHEGHRETVYVDALSCIDRAAGLLDSDNWPTPGREPDVADSQHSHECHVDSEADCLEARIEQRLIDFNAAAQDRFALLRLLTVARGIAQESGW